MAGHLRMCPTTENGKKMTQKWPKSFGAYTVGIGANLVADATGALTDDSGAA